MAFGVSLCRTDFMARSRPVRADTTMFNPQDETASMPFTSTFGFQAKSTLLRLLICASLSLGSPHLFAQASPATANGPALQAKTDLAQFVQHNLQSRVNGLPQEFPLDIADIQDLKDAKIGYGSQAYMIDPGDIVAGRVTWRAALSGQANRHLAFYNHVERAPDQPGHLGAGRREMGNRGLRRGRTRQRS
jgi:hypothetical protein